MKVFYMLNNKGTSDITIPQIVTYGSIAGNQYGLVWTDYDVKLGYTASITLSIEEGSAHLIYFVAQTEFNDYTDIIVR